MTSEETNSGRFRMKFRLCKKVVSFVLVFLLVFGLFGSPIAYANTTDMDQETEEGSYIEQEPIQYEEETKETEVITDDVKNTEEHMEKSILKDQVSTQINAFLAGSFRTVKADENKQLTKASYGFGDTIAEVFPDPALARYIAAYYAQGGVGAVFTPAIANSVTEIKMNSVILENVLDLTGIEYLSNVQKIDLPRLGITTLPGSIGNLANLQYLDLSSNKLTTLPTDFSDLTSLQYLDLSNNKLTSIPDSIGNLTDLQMLAVGNNKLTSIPDSIGNLVKLNKFVLDENQFISLPSNIGNLANLQYLSLSNNQLTSVPASIGSLTKLELLSLYNNQLTSIPDSIGNLTNLRDLDFGFNQLTSVPASIGNLTQLVYLGLAYNQLGSLPDSIDNLMLLERFDVNCNELISLPQNIGNLAKLWEFNLEENQLTSLPESFGNLAQLRNLFLRMNELTTLPDSFVNLTSLTWFDAEENKINKLPDNIGDMTQLKEFDVAFNELVRIPDGIGNLVNLVALNLAYNQLTSVPDSIGNLTNLKELSIFANKLTSIPDSISKLPNLKSLYLLENQLIDVNEELYNMPVTSEYYLREQIYETTLATAYLGRNYTQQALPIFTQVLTYGDDTEIEYTLVKPDASEVVIAPSIVNGKFIIDGSNLSSLGEYKLIATIRGGKLNNSIYTLNFPVGKSTPEIALTGANPQQITRGNTYEELGCVATDAAFGDITNGVVIDASNVDIGTLGNYTVTYTITNDYGNQATITRTVQVVKKVYTVLEDFETFTGSGTRYTRVDTDMSEFKGVSINGVEIDPSNYTITEGSTIITLNESYLKTLANGEYAIESSFEDGNTQHMLKVAVVASDRENKKAETSSVVPKTGDNSTSIGMLVTLFGFSGLVLSQMLRRKRQSS